MDDLDNKLNIIISNQNYIKNLLYLVIKMLNDLSNNENNPDDFIKNVFANIIGDDIEWNKRGKYIK